MPRSKAPDEVFCTSCGEPIKQQAEICPHCGVRNNHSTSPQHPRRHPTPSEDPTTSPNWWYGVAGATTLWVILIVVVSLNPRQTYDTVLGFLVLVAWIGLPLTAYFDMRYVRHHSDWQPNTAIWLIGLLIWFVNILFGIVYLIRRHETLGNPSHPKND